MIALALSYYSVLGTNVSKEKKKKIGLPENFF
jgi:hypothetical protein